VTGRYNPEDGPLFQLRIDGGRSSTRWLTWELREQNPDETEMLAWLDTAAVGDEYHDGGGGFTCYTLRRVA
jgi:hypothetical protein